MEVLNNPYQVASTCAAGGIEMKTNPLLPLFIATSLCTGSCSRKQDVVVNVVEKCVNDFGLPDLKGFKFEVLLSNNGVFESPIYHFKLIEGDLSNLKQLLAQSGFKDWQAGELSFDGVSFGWKQPDLQYSKIQRDGATYYVAISDQLQEIIFIRFP